MPLNDIHCYTAIYSQSVLGKSMENRIKDGESEMIRFTRLRKSSSI